MARRAMHVLSQERVTTAGTVEWIVSEKALWYLIEVQGGDRGSRCAPVVVEGQREVPEEG